MEKKVIDENGKFKTFTMKVKDCTLDEREEINNMIFDQKADKNFSWFLKVLEIGTDYTREQINEYNNEQIFAMAGVVISSINKKK